MSRSEDSPRYVAYLLRCWEEKQREEGQRRSWRFSLEDAHTGQRQGFASLEEVVAFLRRLLENTDTNLSDS